jgi:cobalt-zinc-cadmium efflux system outer membrane protein
MHQFFIPLGVAFSIAAPASIAYAQQFTQLSNNVADAADIAPIPRFQLRVVLEPASPLTLAAAVSLALEQNSDISATRNELSAVSAEVQQAGARPNPEIAVLMEDTRKQSRSTTFQINQPIELGGKRKARIGAAERARDIASIALAIRRADIRTDVTAAFFEVLTAQERQRLSAQSVELAKTAATMAARRVTAGKAPPLEETKARIAESAARLEAGQAVSELSSARKRLSAFWGSATPQFTTAEGTGDMAPSLPEISDLMMRLDNAPALRLARAEVERQQALTGVESSKRIPDLTVSAGAKRDEEAQRNMWIVGVSMPIPLFDSNQGNVLAALRRTDQARDKLASAEIRLHADVSAAYERLKNARREITVFQTDILPGAQSAYAAAGKGFQLGKFSFLEVLDAQRTLFQAKSQYLHALSEAYKAAAELDRLAGQPG